MLQQGAAWLPELGENVVSVFAAQPAHRCRPADCFKPGTPRQRYVCLCVGNDERFAGSLVPANVGYDVSLQGQEFCIQVLLLAHSLQVRLFFPPM
jgi:hypothetical protein